MVKIYLFNVKQDIDLMIVVHTIDYCSLHCGPMSPGVSIEGTEIKILKIIYYVECGVRESLT